MIGLPEIEMAPELSEDPEDELHLFPASFALVGSQNSVDLEQLDLARKLKADASADLPGVCAAMNQALPAKYKAAFNWRD